MRTPAVLVALSLLVAGCAGMGTGTGSPGATAEIRNAAGAVVGSAAFTETASGVRIVVEARGLPPGPKGSHPIVEADEAETVVAGEDHLAE